MAIARRATEKTDTHFTTTTTNSTEIKNDDKNRTYRKIKFRNMRDYKETIETHTHIYMNKPSHVCHIVIRKCRA